jgi:transcriptional regulator with XRE-family HTH domain
MLKAARNAAGLSREEAAHRCFIGARTLADYESGRTVAPPDVVMRMAELYQEPALTADYCAKVCPIGQVLAHTVDRSEFAVMVLRVLKEFADVERLKDRLIHIASDGKVCVKELDEFKAIMREMVELERQIGELKFFALRHGIEISEIMPASAPAA